MPLQCVIIDDSLFIRQTVGSIIESSGHKVSATFSNGPSFLNNLSEIDPDVIFCDIILPEMTGLDLLEIINEGFPKAKVIMLSGVTHAEAISAALRLGAIDFLQKPVNKERLQSLLDKIQISSEGVSVEKLSTIGVVCELLTGFLDELVAHSSSLMRRIVKQQISGILIDLKPQTKGMLIIDEESFHIEPDPALWGVYSEEVVITTLKRIPDDLRFELQFLYSEEFVDNLFDQAIATMGAKKRFSDLAERVNMSTLGLPEIPVYEDVTKSLIAKAGTTFEELDRAISLAVFVFDPAGPEIITRINPDLISEQEIMKNSIFFYALIGEEESFQEGLFGPLPVSAENSSLSSLTYSMKRVNITDKQERVVILSVYYEPSAEGVVSDYNKLSFLIRTRSVPIKYVHEFDKTVLRALLDDIIDYVLAG